MTENWLEYDQKISQRQTLLIEYDKKMFATANQIFWIWPKFMTPTNINFTPQKYAVAVELDLNQIGNRQFIIFFINLLYRFVD